jgi:SAM-dependent methyltransferase
MIKDLLAVLPWFLQTVITPGLQNSQYAYVEALHAHCRTGIAWLDLGCGRQLLREWMSSRCQIEAALLRRPRLFVGIDRDLPSLRKNHVSRNLVAGEIENLPFGDGIFDLVTANMVVEHVRHPERLVSEVCRVLKPGGEFLFHTPNRWGYTTVIARLLPQRVKVWLARLLERREQADCFPTFYRLNTMRAIAARAHEHRMEVTESSLVESSAETVGLGPFAVFELLLIRTLRARALNAFRPGLIVVLKKHAAPDWHLVFEYDPSRAGGRRASSVEGRVVKTGSLLEPSAPIRETRSDG